MPDQTPASGEQPSANVETPVIETTTTQTPETPVVETPQTPATPTEGKKDPPAPTLDEVLATVKVSEMSEEQLEALNSGDAARIREALGVKDAPPAPDAPKEQPKAQEQQPQAKDGDHDLRRISLKALKTPEERTAIAEAVQMVRDGKYADIKSALVEVFRLNNAPPAAPEATNGKEAHAEQPPEVAPEVKAIEDKIAALETERKAARDAYDYDVAEAKLAEIMEAKLDLRDARREAAQKAQQAKSQEAEQAKQKAAEDLSVDRAMAKYGELMTDPESEFGDYIEVEIALAERKNDSILSQPDWPEKIADRVFGKYFNGSQAANSAHEPPASPIPPPPPGIRLPGSPVGSGANSTVPTAAAASIELSKLTPEERIAALTLADERSANRRR